MPKKLICTLPNASTLISGIAFEPHKRGMISVDVVPEDVAKRFADIDGYVTVEDDPKSAEKAAKEAAEKAAAEQAAKEAADKAAAEQAAKDAADKEASDAAAKADADKAAEEAADKASKETKSAAQKSAGKASKSNEKDLLNND